MELAKKYKFIGYYGQEGQEHGAAYQNLENGKKFQISNVEMHEEAKDGDLLSEIVDRIYNKKFPPQSPMAQALNAVEKTGNA